MSEIKKIPVHTKCGELNIHATQTVYEMSKAVVIETGDKLITVPGDEMIKDNFQNIEQDHYLFSIREHHPAEQGNLRWREVGKFRQRKL